MSELDKYVGKTVCASVSSLGVVRNGFHTQMSVTGTLDAHPDGERYRVLVENSTFAYFRYEDVTVITQASNAAIPVLHLRIEEEVSNG